LYYRCGSQWKEFTGVEKCGLKSLDTVAHKLDNAVWEWINNLLCDPQALEDGLQEMINSRANELAPKHNRLGLLDSLVQDEEKRTKRLIRELSYQNDEVVISALRAEIDQSTKAYKALMEERERLVQEIAQSELTGEQYDQVMLFATKIRHKLAEASFEEKRRIMDILEVRGVLHYDEQGKWLEVSCAIPSYNDAIELPPSEVKLLDRGRVDKPSPGNDL
jgi:chorismate mutase